MKTLADSLKLEQITNFERWLNEQGRRAEHDWDRNKYGKYDRGFWDAISMVQDQFDGMIHEGRGR
jgi:hypothetical protein